MHSTALFLRKPVQVIFKRGVARVKIGLEFSSEKSWEFGGLDSATRKSGALAKLSSIICSATLQSGLLVKHETPHKDWKTFYHCTIGFRLNRPIGVLKCVENCQKWIVLVEWVAFVCNDTVVVMPRPRGLFSRKVELIVENIACFREAPLCHSSRLLLNC